MMIPLTLLSQTKQLEEAYAKEQWDAGKYTGDQYGKIGRAWARLLADFDGGYPELPYDREEERMKFEYIIELEGVTKAIIQTRLKEWTAINFGSIDAVLHYEDVESGKLILKGNFRIPYIDDYQNFWGQHKQRWESATCFQNWSPKTTKVIEIPEPAPNSGARISYYRLLLHGFLPF